MQATLDQAKSSAQSESREALAEVERLRKLKDMEARRSAEECSLCNDRAAFWKKQSHRLDDELLELRTRSATETADLRLQVSRRGLTAAIPMESPCCSCELTRVRSCRSRG